MTVIFPKWTNQIATILGAGAVFAGSLVTFVVWYYFSPKNTDVGYAPDQPVLYSHRLHAGVMGIDCRYCHTSVEIGPHANVPPTETCMNCHKLGWPNNLEVQKIVKAHEAGMPLRWKKVHLLPDYAYFNHAAHVRVGVGCRSCHGRIDQLEVVRQVEPLSMSWCLECHRDPAPSLRPLDRVTDMAYEQSSDDLSHARELVADGTINPPTHCSGCHR